jgi:hypothetical protein
MASTWSLLGSTSMLSDVTPRAWARLISARTSAEPTPLALPGVRHHHSDISHRAAPGGGPVGGHGVPDDDAAVDGDQYIDAASDAGQLAEHGRGRADRREEPPEAGPHGKPGEEAAERGQVGRVRPADGGGHASGNLVLLGSVHRPSMAADC